MVVSAKRISFVFILINSVNLEYAGEDFPQGFINPDGKLPSDSDLVLYLDGMARITNYLMNNINYTDVNQAITAFLAKAMLKRTLQDYSHKLEKYKITMKLLINNITDVISHYVYLKSSKNWESLEYRLSRVFKDDRTTVYSIRRLKNGILKRWILRISTINEFVQMMDNLSLPKENYVKLVETIDGSYDITGYDSDTCLSRLIENIDPVNESDLKPCKQDNFCRAKMFTSPSVAYSLSHRLLNSMLYMHARRCYHFSPIFDNAHMDILCAAMYREAVYIARRGYFYRDIFMEQIGLCGQLGYEEFHRRHWFRKVVSWINEDGCIQEFGNFEINRTRLITKKTANREEIRQIRKRLKSLLQDECHHHLMAVAMMVLANAVRHAVHFINDES